MAALFAGHTVLLAHGGHDELSAPSIRTTKTFNIVTQGGAKGVVTLICDVLTPTSSADVSYRATIVSGVSGPVVLSLYNLGLQGRACDVEITAVSDGVEISEPRSSSSDPLKWKLATREKIVRGKVKNGSVTPPGPPEDHRLRMIRFSHACVIDLTSNRQIHSPMTKSNHDTVPPPSEPGGQDGESL